jgi:hypothetical protein
MNIEIIVTLEFERLHHWPACQIPSVLYLRNLHRHLFKVTCWKKVRHEDRDIEIITFKNEVLAFCEAGGGLGDDMTLSCEAIAMRILRTFELSRCRVLEDGENGAEVTP